MTAARFIEDALSAARQPGGREFTRYFGCSLAALCTDFALFSSCLRLGLGYGLAAGIGFTAGLCVAYVLSIRLVFATRSIDDERVEFLLFSGIGLLGLLMTEVLLWSLVSGAGWSPLWAKLPTAGLVFLFNFGARKALLFTRRRKAVPA
jgi:putative flippase GtrA